MRYAALSAALLLASSGVASAQPAPVEPIDDLQRLFIEDTVALIKPPSAAAGERARTLMEAAAAARAAGNNGEMRRNLAQARVLLAGGTWSREVAFTASLALRPQRIVLDPSRPLTVEIGQRFTAAAPEGKLSLALGLRRKGAREIDWRGDIAPTQTDLIDAPALLTVGLDGLADGTYDLVLRATADGKLVGDTALGVYVVAGLDRDLAEIARRTATMRMRPALRASVSWPADLARTLDDRTRQPVDVAWRPLLDRTLAILNGTDPLIGAKGERERHYASAVSGRIEPYRLIVPECWDGKARLPLVVLLHGSNGDHNKPFASGEAARLAARHCWAVMAPMGYSPNGGWGNHLPVVLANGSAPAPRPSTIAGVVLPRDGVDPEPAEADVLDALAAVRAEYPIDSRRIYLAGNSMGGEGVWHLAQRHRELWAAAAPGAGAIDPAHYPYPRLGKLPVLAVHGDQDEIISYAASADMVARLNRAGGKGHLLTVPNGGHRSFETVLDQVFAFFAGQSRKAN